MGSHDERAYEREKVNVIGSDHATFATEKCATQQPRAIRSAGEVRQRVFEQRLSPWVMVDRSLVWRVFFEPQMATALVIVGDVRSYKSDEMTLTENHDVLEELSTTASNPALGGSVTITA